MGFHGAPQYPYWSNCFIIVSWQAAQDVVAAATRRREMLKAVMAKGKLDAADGSPKSSPCTPAKPSTGTHSTAAVNEAGNENLMKRARGKTTPIPKSDPSLTPSVCTPAPKTAKVTVESTMQTPTPARKSLSFSSTGTLACTRVITVQ